MLLTHYSEDLRQEVKAAIQHSSSGKLAKAEFENPRQHGHYSECTISFVIMECLDRAEVAVDPWLRPSTIGGDVCSLPALPLEYFPIFEREGVAGYNDPESQGLRPIMNGLRVYYSLSKTKSPLENIHELLPWPIQHRCLDITLARPYKYHKRDVKLNESVTGYKDVPTFVHSIVYECSFSSIAVHRFDRLN